MTIPPILTSAFKSVKKPENKSDDQNLKKDDNAKIKTDANVISKNEETKEAFGNKTEGINGKEEKIHETKDHTNDSTYANIKDTNSYKQSVVDNENNDRNFKSLEQEKSLKNIKNISFSKQYVVANENNDSNLKSLEEKKSNEKAKDEYKRSDNVKSGNNKREKIGPNNDYLLNSKNIFVEDKTGENIFSNGLVVKDELTMEHNKMKINDKNGVVATDRDLYSKINNGTKITKRNFNNVGDDIVLKAENNNEIMYKNAYKGKKTSSESGNETLRQKNYKNDSSTERNQTNIITKQPLQSSYYRQKSPQRVKTQSFHSEVLIERENTVTKHAPSGELFYNRRQLNSVNKKAPRVEKFERPREVYATKAYVDDDPGYRNSFMYIGEFEHLDAIFEEDLRRYRKKKDYSPVRDDYYGLDEYEFSNPLYRETNTIQLQKHVPQKKYILKKPVLLVDKREESPARIIRREESPVKIIRRSVDGPARIIRSEKIPVKLNRSEESPPRLIRRSVDGSARIIKRSEESENNNYFVESKKIPTLERSDEYGSFCKRDQSGQRGRKSRSPYRSGFEPEYSYVKNQFRNASPRERKTSNSPEPKNISYSYTDTVISYDSKHKIKNKKNQPKISYKINNSDSDEEKILATEHSNHERTVSLPVSQHRYSTEQAFDTEINYQRPQDVKVISSKYEVRHAPKSLLSSPEYYPNREVVKYTYPQPLQYGNSSLRKYSRKPNHSPEIEVKIDKFFPLIEDEYNQNSLKKTDKKFTKQKKMFLVDLNGRFSSTDAPNRYILREEEFISKQKTNRSSSDAFKYPQQKVLINAKNYNNYIGYFPPSVNEYKTANQSRLLIAENNTNNFEFSNSKKETTSPSGRISSRNFYTLPNKPARTRSSLNYTHSYYVPSIQYVPAKTDIENKNLLENNDTLHKGNIRTIKGIENNSLPKYPPQIIRVSRDSYSRNNNYRNSMNNFDAYYKNKRNSREIQSKHNYIYNDHSPNSYPRRHMSSVVVGGQHGHY